MNQDEPPPPPPGGDSGLLDVFCPLLSLDDHVCSSLFRLPALSMLLAGACDDSNGNNGSPSSSSPPPSDPSFSSCSFFSFCSESSLPLTLASTASHQMTPGGGGGGDGGGVEAGGGAWGAAVVSCFASGSGSCVLFVLAVLGLYLVLLFLLNAVACYNFVVAWNLIARMYRVDLTFLSSGAGDRRFSRSRPRHGRAETVQQQESGVRALQQEQQEPQQPTRNYRRPFSFSGFRSPSSLVRARTRKASRVMLNEEDACCPVCLEEFCDQQRQQQQQVHEADAGADDYLEEEPVALCEDGCGAAFHTRCLAEWLERSDSCPCCRRVMVPPRHPPPGGCWHDLTVFLGYAPAR